MDATEFSDVESLSSSNSSDEFDDTDDYYSSSYGGQALTVFSRLEETIEKIDDFLTFERCFLQGDVVTLESDPLGPRGKVVGLSMTVSLEDIHGGKIPNVLTKDLERIRSASPGDYVVLGPWIGKVGKIVDRLTILFDDGAKRQLTLDGTEKIVSLSQDVVEDPSYPFYPGQRVKVESAPAASKSSIWFCGVRKNVRKFGTICRVDAGQAYVDWLFCCLRKDGERIPPSNFQDVKDLTVLPCSANANWQMGDWCALPSQEHGRRGISDVLQQIAVVVKTKTKVDVLWQDGSKSLGVDSDSLSPVNVVDVHDFWPNAFVLEKGANDGSRIWGFVRNVDAKERTVKVKWSSASSSEEEEEFVSAYELTEHPDYTYGLGEVVFRAAEDFCPGKADDFDPLESDEEDRSDYASCFGTVVGFEDGNVEVKWVGGGITKVAPYEIYRVDGFEEGTASFMNDAENLQNPDTENLRAKNQLFGKNFTEDSLGFSYEASPCSISQAAMRFFAGMTSSLFSSLGTSLIGGYRCTDEEVEEEEEDEQFNHGEESMELCEPYGAASSTGQNEPMKITLPESTEENSEEYGINNMNDPSSSSNPKSYKQFDVVSNCSDHHFVNESAIDFQSPQAKRQWLKKVHQEWSILEKDLPDSIYVRVYEENLGFLRAAIVGPAGTPYHDGLFFFDVYLPPQYPYEPPMVHYHSNGLRINPNLYESGKVCLSILNTWGGSPCEMWDPKTSTVLQVLVSIQGLVLNARPYFNEAGFDSQVGKAEGEKNSLSYNENAFLLSCRSTLYLLRKPPKHFEALVAEHFGRRGRDVLMACNEYMRGAPIGGWPSCVEIGTNVDGNSKGFKIMLGKLLPKLEEAFSETGLDCAGFSGPFG